MDTIFLCNQFRDAFATAESCIKQSNQIELCGLKMSGSGRRDIEELMEEQGKGLVRVILPTELTEFAVQLYPVDYELKWVREGTTEWKFESLRLKRRELERWDLEYPEKYELKETQ